MSGKLRRLAQRAKNAAQTCRLLAIAAVLDGASREDAAKIGGASGTTIKGRTVSSTFHHRAHRPSSMPSIKSFVRIVDEGPIPAVHVVRWRACDLVSCCHTRDLGSRCRTIRSIALSRT